MSPAASIGAKMASFFSSSEEWIEIYAVSAKTPCIGFFSSSEEWIEITIPGVIPLTASFSPQSEEWIEIWEASLP